MISIVILISGFLLAVLTGEIALRGIKSQTGFSRMVVVHAIIGLPILLWLFVARGVSPGAVGVFWFGGFLSWFFIRGSIESSIILRMLTLLRDGPLRDLDLLAQYEAVCHQRERIEGLLQAGLVVWLSRGLFLTRKGRIILAAFEIIRKS